jgi:hypothetical protein
VGVSKSLSALDQHFADSVAGYAVEVDSKVPGLSFDADVFLLAK